MQLLFVWQYRPGKCVYEILERKNTFLSYKNKKFKKSKNWHCFKGANPWFWSKNGPFSNFFGGGNIGQENVFYDILEWKNAFQDYKNKKFKKSKNWHFSKGVNPWSVLVKKWPFFQLLFFIQYRPEKCLLRYCTSKKRFLAYKNKKFKKSKNWHFSKRVNQ